MSRINFCYKFITKRWCCYKNDRFKVANFITAFAHNVRSVSTSGNLRNGQASNENSLLKEGVYQSSSNKLRRRKRPLSNDTMGDSRPMSSENNTKEMHFLQNMKKDGSFKTGSMKEKLHQTYFGYVRFDENNPPSVKPQQNQNDRTPVKRKTRSSETDFVADCSEFRSAKDQNSTLFDEQYFAECMSNENISKTNFESTFMQNRECFEASQYSSKPKDLTDSNTMDSNTNDQEHGQTSIVKDHEAQSVLKSTLKSGKLGDSGLADELNYFDKSLFEQSGYDYKRTISMEKRVPSTKNSYKFEKDSSHINHNIVDRNLNYFDETLFINYSGASQAEQKSFDDVQQHIDKRLEPRFVEINSKITAESTNVDGKQTTNVDESVNAYDVVKNIRQEQKKNKGEPLLSDQNKQESVKAYDVVKTIRQEQKKKGEPSHSDQNEQAYKVNPWMKTWDGKTDSQGFKILEDQVIDVQRMPQDILVSILKKSILYEDDNLVAINKPYGLPSHGGPGVNNSIGQLLDQLAKRIDKQLDNLYLVHRLDKESTGVMLLAKSAKTTEQLSQLFKTRQVIKKYLVITKGVPNPEEGVIDIPLTEGTVEGKYRMTLKPRYSAEMKNALNIYQSRGMSGAFEAITNFKVLDSYGSAALVECQPETGVKHQIRCHLAFALNTPILGDHKYSHLSKIAPQKLYADMLQRLGIRQAKVRHVPMHLHSSQLILPQFREGRNFFLTARLPKHFLQNMKWLNLRLPK